MELVPCLKYSAELPPLVFTACVCDPPPKPKRELAPEGGYSREVDGFFANYC